MEKKEWQKNFEDTIILMMGRTHLRARDVIEELVPMVELELDKAREEGIEKGYKSGWKDSQTLAGLRESEKDTYFDDEDIDELNRLEKIEESI